MKTIVEIKDWDGYLVADSMERDGSELVIYSKYMSVCTAIDLLNTDCVINGFVVCEDCGCTVSVDVSRVSKIYFKQED